ncbi:MAG: glycosyltransferase [Candidatus Moranbacteria bacterium]|nr:glycosyltransferase [Candidatus Moranbacteria bacterium]
MKTLPLVSVIVTTKNEEFNISSCLKSLLSQTYPQDKNEIIVVDNNSTDKTKDIVEEFARGFTQLNLKVFNYGPERSAQRNYGIAKSSGEYFLYLDADMTLSKNVIKDCVDRITVIPAQAGIQSNNLVGLYISEIVTGNSFWSKVRRFERSFYDGTVIDCVRFIKKEIFQKVGGFDENLTGPEDWDLDKKIRKACPVASDSSATGVGLIKTPIYHNEAEFNLKKYLTKKSYYAKNFDIYISKWSRSDNFQSDGIKAKIDPDIKRQFGFYYRFLGVFIEKRKLVPSDDSGWKKILVHPILFGGILTLRILVGLKFLLR